MNFFSLIGCSLLISSLAVPSFSLSNNSNNFIELANGDFSLKDVGSVTEELTRFGYDLSDYELGLKGDTPFTILENGENVYLYIFKSNGFLDFNKISFGYYEGDLKNFSYDSLSYVEKDINLVSFDKNHQFGKFLINDIAPNLYSDHVYLVREIYQEENKENSEFIQGIGLIYQYNSKNSEIKIINEETINVTNKLVAYEVYPYNESLNSVEKIYQRNYVAFSTDKKMDDLLKVKLKYNGYYYGGYTDIALDFTHFTQQGDIMFYNFADKLENKDVRNHILEDWYYNEFNRFEDKVVDIEDEYVSVNFTIDNGWWNMDKVNSNFTYNTIEKTTELDPELVINEDIFNYDYVVTFDSHPVDVFATTSSSNSWIFWEEINSSSNIFVGVTCPEFQMHVLYDSYLKWPEDEKNQFKEMIGLSSSSTDEDVYQQLVDNGYGYSTYNSNTYLTKDILNNLDSNDIIEFSNNAMLEVENLTLLQFTYVVNNEVKEAIVIDTYTDSSGGNQFQDNDAPIINGWNNFIDSVGDFFTNGFGQAITIIVALIVIIMLIKFIISIIKLFKKK